MKPWSHLALDEQRYWHTRMTLENGKSVNGVAGWYHTLRTRKKPLAAQKKPMVHLTGISLADTAPDPITLEEIQDVLPDRTYEI